MLTATSWKFNCGYNGTERLAKADRFRFLPRYLTWLGYQQRILVLSLQATLSLT